MAVSITESGQTVTAEYGTALVLLYLREQLADSSMWKALVETPTATWSSAKTLADAGTSSRPNALDAIRIDRVTSAASATSADAIIRALNSTDIERMSLNDWDVSGLLLLVIDLPIPSAYQGPDKIGVATIDFFNKIGRIQDELMSLSQTAERLTISQIGRGPSGQLNDDDNNAIAVRGIELLVRYRGPF